MSMKEHMLYKEEQRKKHEAWLKAQTKNYENYEKEARIFKGIMLFVFTLAICGVCIILYHVYG